MAENSNYIPQAHPVSRLLQASAYSGSALTGDDLASLDRAEGSIPGGGSFAGMKADISRASRNIAALKSEGRNQEARELADATGAELAGRMTTQQRAVTDSSIAKFEENARDLGDIDAMVRDNLSRGY